MTTFGDMAHFLFVNASIHLGNLDDSSMLSYLSFNRDKATYYQESMLLE